MENQITISESDVFDAYKNGTQEDKCKQKDITERIKIFKDACFELERGNCLVQEYLSTTDNATPDLLAYIKLRIVCAALNEGWEPQFTEDESRYYPLFWLYTQEEINKMGEDGKTDRRLTSTGDYRTGYAGFACANSIHTPSNTYANFGSRLCLKSEKLAIYCGKQFIDLWADFYLIRKGK